MGRVQYCYRDGVILALRMKNEEPLQRRNVTASTHVTYFFLKSKPSYKMI